MTELMNDLPAIGYRAMPKELWDRQGANIACRWKEIYGEKLFPHPKTGILEGDQHFFAVVLSQMDLRNVECGKCKFCQYNCEICDKIYG